MDQSDKLYDTIIVGGSYAGLSAAMALGRSLRDVLVIDAGEPCNAQTPHSHNFLTRDGETPAAIAAIGRKQVEAYPTVLFLDDFVTDARREVNYFKVVTASNKVVHSRTLLLATGLKDIFPDVSGLKECWGISILHCPYCHGYEVRHKKLAVMVNGDASLEFVRLIRHWSKDITVLTNGAHQFSEESMHELKVLNVPVIESRLASIEHDNGILRKVHFENGEALSFDAAFTRLAFDHSPLVSQIGCALTSSGHVAVDELGKTSVDDVYAAGDCTTQMRSVSAAVAGGTKGGAAINRMLIERDTSSPALVLKEKGV